MAIPPTNVERLREAGVIPDGGTLDPADESAINALDEEDINVVVSLYGQVGRIEVAGLPAAAGRTFIF
jgi:hypothetical protein